MFIYWLMFFIPVGMTLLTNPKEQTKWIPMLFLALFFILVIGFRNEVGCDWFSYVMHYERTVGVNFTQAFELVKDPAHAFVNWWMGKWHEGIYGINFIYAIIFVTGLIQFSRTQTYPWLALAVAVPYMVVMVSMGYSRQGVALGLFMLAITYLEKGKFKTYIFWVLMAATFHKTAIILLPFGLFLSKSGIWLRLVFVIPVLYGGWDLLLAEKQEQLWNAYVEQNMHSSGAKIRVAMNLIPALILLLYRRKWKVYYRDYPFWFWIAIASIISAVLVGVATTAVDRISLYFIPLQLAVYSRLPYLAKEQINPNVTKVLILFGYAAVLFVWLFFAAHSHCWIPYKNIFFETII